MNPTAASTQVIAPGALLGRTCLITGAGSGIGRAIALRFAALGAHVVGVGRRIEPLQQTARLAHDSPGSFHGESCDVRDADAIVALIRSVGDANGLNIVVNNAGGQFASRAESISRRGWNAVIDLNLTALFTITQAAFPYLAREGGSIINISLSHVERGSPGIAHAIAARAGVLGFTKTIALEWAARGIRANCIGPGVVTTYGAQEGYDPALVAKLNDSAPLRRNTSTQEVAELAAFLASPAGAMMTGQLIQIDGGSHLGGVMSVIDDDGAACR